MAEPFSPQRKTIFPLIFGIGIGVILLVAILVIFVGYQFSQYRSEGGDLLQAEANQILIVAPALGSESPLGFPILITAKALGPHPFLSTELWVDGQLVEVQAGPSGGSIPLNAIFSWIPTTPGAHSLVARAINTETQSVYSTSVVVFITSKLDASQTAVDTEGSAGGDGVADEQASNGGDNGGGGSYVPPEPPVPGDSVAPGKPWKGSAAEWITNMTAGQSPSTPELIASAETCAASLSIHDLSDNEEGFVIYRQVSGSPAWEQVAALASSNGDWLTYTEDNVFGGLLYYVAAFNSQGEANSNLALVNIDPADCPSQAAAPSKLTLELVSISFEAEAKKTYCYRSFDGLQWARWPQDGFLNSHNEPILLSDLAGEPLFETFDLMLECWGWAGEDLVYLGNALFSDLNPRETGPMRAEAENLSIELLLSSRVNPALYPLGGSSEVFENLAHAGFNLPLLSADMPMVLPSLTYDPNVCGSHLPPDKQNLFGQLFLCLNYPEYTAGINSNNPQPYLVWSVSDKCLLGVGSPPCKSYRDWIKLAASVPGGHVGFTIQDHSNAGNFTYQVTEPFMHAFVIPPVGCLGSRSLKVNMWFSEKNSPDVLQGPASYPVQVPCPPMEFKKEGGSVQDFTLIQVTFNTLTISEADDGDDDTLEIYGKLRVEGMMPGGQNIEGFVPSNVRIGLHDELGPAAYDNWADLSIATWEDQHSKCADDIDDDVDEATQKEYFCPHRITNGSYNLADFYMCKKTYNASGCYDWNVAPMAHWSTDILYNNNTLTVIMLDDSALWILIDIWDWDDYFGDDEACKGWVEFIPRSNEEWANFDNEPFTITYPKLSSGYCTVSGVVSAVGSYP